jgi:hypothetical protein
MHRTFQDYELKYSNSWQEEMIKNNCQWSIVNGELLMVNGQRKIATKHSQLAIHN